MPRYHKIQYLGGEMLQIVVLPRGERCADCSPGSSPGRAAFSRPRVMPQVGAPEECRLYNFPPQNTIKASFIISPELEGNEP